MKEKEGENYSFQLLYQKTKNEYETPIADPLLLEDIKLMVKNLHPEVVSVYEEWPRADEDNDDYTEEENKIFDEILKGRHSSEKWEKNISYFFNTDLIKYLRFKTVFGTFTIGKNVLCTFNKKIEKPFLYCIYDYDGEDIVSLKKFLSTLNFQSNFYSTVPETRALDTVYFSINNWFGGCNYPITNQMIEWLRPGYESMIFSNEEWDKKNKLIVCFNDYDMSDSYAVTASLAWVKRFFPEILGSVYEIISPDGSPPRAKRPFWKFKSPKEEAGLYSCNGSFLRYDNEDYLIEDEH